eukprot:9732037-Alexandrium_andersonii.AAC.1
MGLISCGACASAHHQLHPAPRPHAGPWKTMQGRRKDRQPLRGWSAARGPSGSGSRTGSLLHHLQDRAVAVRDFLLSDGPLRLEKLRK